MNIKKQDSLYYCIATDKYNLLKDNDNMIVYFFKKLYYRIKLSFKYEAIIKWKKIKGSDH